MNEAKRWMRLIQRIEARGIKVGDCIEWTGPVNHNGYGAITFRNGGPSSSTLVHRAYWKAHNDKKISAKDYICHHCDNRLCFNLKPLYKGTARTNALDMANRGRRVYNPLLGEKHPLSKLTEAQVKKIRKMLLSGMTQCKIAAEIGGIDQTTVSSIKTGRQWTHVK